MEHPDNRNDNQHIIEIASTSGAVLSSLSVERLPTGLEHQQGESQPSTRSRIPPFFSAGSTSRNSSVTQRGNSRDRLRRPMSSNLWISLESVLTISQIIAAIVVLCFSKDEKPDAPLRVWIVGYTSGCFVILPFLYWRFIQRNQASAQDASQRTNNVGPLNRRSTEGEDGQTTAIAAGGAQNNGLPTNRRVKACVEYLRMALDCYFAVWFVIGNVWIFGGHSSAGAPNLYRLCVVFLIVSCVGYAMPFIVCCGLCCCLPCIISYLGIREDFLQDSGATQDSINSLPTYKFKVKKGKSRSDKSSSSSGVGGVVAAGTEKERSISGDDAVCSICLVNYENNDELRELPCSHIFHKECIDKWLKINASCPLCKAEIVDTILSSPPTNSTIV